MLVYLCQDRKWWLFNVNEYSLTADCEDNEERSVFRWSLCLHSRHWESERQIEKDKRDICLRNHRNPQRTGRIYRQTARCNWISDIHSFWWSQRETALLFHAISIEAYFSDNFRSGEDREFRSVPSQRMHYNASNCVKCIQLACESVLILNILHGALCKLRLETFKIQCSIVHRSVLFPVHWTRTIIVQLMHQSEFSYQSDTRVWR